MAGREYLDFDLTIEANDDGRYFSRVIASPAGEASSGFVFPFNALELENYLLKLGPTRPVVRRIDSPHVHTARQFGSTLYQAVFSGEVGTTYLRSFDAAQHEAKGLRLRLRLSEAPVLSGLPWEFLHDEDIGDFLVLSERRPLVRYPELPSAVEPLGVAAPLRVLLIVSSPSDHIQLDVDREQRLLQEALAGPIADGRVEVTLLERPTLSSLRSALRRSDVHILHYIGHGGFDNQTDEGVLLFEDEQGKGRRVSASSLGTILYDHDPLRLVVLNACEGARTGTNDPFSGVAPELVRRGAPAVIAMQFEITDQAAITFSHEFYLAVADGYPVDAATASARKAIFAEGNGLEWATPVLYLRSPDGMIFDLQQPPPSAERVSVSATETADTDDEEDDSHPDVLTPAEQATLREAALSGTLERASDALQAGNWQEASRLFQQVLAERPDDEEAVRGLERATMELERREVKTPPEEDIHEDGPPNNRLWLLIGGPVVVVLAIVLAIINWPTEEESGTTTTEGPGTTTTVEISTPATYLVASFAEPPAIDGVEEDWPSVTRNQTPAVAEGREDPRVESSWRFGWDDDALYLFVEVADPNPLTTPYADEPEFLYRGDGINFIFGPDPTGLPEDVGLREGEDVMILIGPTSPVAEDAVVAKRVRGESSPEAAGANDCESTHFADTGEEPDVDAAVNRTEAGYNVEAAVPWDELFVAPPPTAGAKFGIIFTVAHAGDGSEDNRSGSRSSHASRVEAKHCPGKWGETIGLDAP